MSHGRSDLMRAAGFEREPEEADTRPIVWHEEAPQHLVVGERAPSGRTYEAWVIKDNKPVRAGTFSGGRATTVVPLEREVPSGSIVAVTLERQPGADAPHGKILLHSESA